MNIVGLMIWYDEPPESLVDSMASIGPHIDYMIAVDGAFSYYPGGSNQSAPEQYDAIKTGLSESGCNRWEIVTPARLWEDEVEKRNYLFSYASYRSVEDEDWYVIWDADMFMLEAGDLHEDLAWTGLSAASFMLLSSAASREQPRLVHRMAYRAHPETQCVGKHSVFGHPIPGGYRYLWGHQDAIPTLDLSRTVCVGHDPGRRSPERLAAKEASYAVQAAREALV